MSAQDHPSGPADSTPQGPAPAAPTHTSQTGGPPWAPPANNQNIEGCQKHVIIINISPKITRIYRNAMEPPMDPLEHLENLVKVQDPLKGRARCWNLTLEHHQAQVLLHNLLDYLKTQ